MPRPLKKDLLHPRFLTLANTPNNHIHLNDCDLCDEAVKTVLRELKLMHEFMPENAFLRIFEDKIGLLRFLIVGAPSTVYFGSYFLFDVSLPADYPQCAPTIFFHAFGQSCNPNLYMDGTVCLSLLGTWSGEGCEQWIPESSNVLQLITGVQGLILGVEQPFYNEPGMGEPERPPRPESVLFNELSFISGLEIACSVIGSPPAEFKELIFDHFRETVPDTIEFLKALIATSPSERDAPPPALLKKMDLRCLYPTLSDGFIAQLPAVLQRLETALASTNTLETL